MQKMKPMKPFHWFIAFVFVAVCFIGFKDTGGDEHESNKQTSDTNRKTIKHKNTNSKTLMRQTAKQ